MNGLPFFFGVWRSILVSFYIVTSFSHTPFEGFIYSVIGF